MLKMTAPARFAAVDVHYFPHGGARAAAVLSPDERFEVIAEQRVVPVDQVAEYEPGQFYRRELPALQAVLEGCGPLQLLIVDGYVDLEPDGRRPGLGAHCFATFGVPVIGVAKTSFRGATHAGEVRRGAASRPLYVTAAGLSVATASELVRSMAGPFRLPDALKQVDGLARGTLTPP
jgi:deoxyribonuclease V